MVTLSGYTKHRIICQFCHSDTDDHHVAEDDSQMVPVDMNVLSDHASMASSEENQTTDVIIPLDARFHCHVLLTRCEVRYEVHRS